MFGISMSNHGLLHKTIKISMPTIMIFFFLRSCMLDMIEQVVPCYCAKDTNFLLIIIIFKNMC